MNNLRKFLKVKILIPITLIVVVLLIGNNLVENYRLHSILKVVSSTERVMNKFNEDMKNSYTAKKGCIKEGKDASKVYCGIELDNWVKNYLAPEARKLNDDLVVGDFSLARVSTFPLGGSYSLAKDKYHSHLQAWIRYSNSLANSADYPSFYRAVMKQNDITTSFKIAKIVFYDAIPTPSLFNNKEKIVKIFEN